MVCGVALSEDVALLHLLALHHNRTHVDTGVLVRSSKLEQLIILHVGIETDQSLCFRLFVFNFNMGGIHRFHHAGALGYEDHAGIDSHLVFQARTHDGCFRTKQRHGLAHHVGTHQRTVSVVVLQERNQGGSDGGDLVRSDVDHVNLLTREDRVIGQTTGFHLFAQQAVLIHRRVSLCDTKVVLLLSSQEDGRFVETDLAVDHATVRRGDEAEVVDLGEHTERGDKTDVRTFRGLNGTQTTIVRVVYVTDLETGALTGETARTQSGNPTFVGDFRQRVRLVHELGQLVGSEEGIHHRRKCLGIDQVHRGEHLVVAHVHLLTDGAGHTVQTHAELVV